MKNISLENEELDASLAREDPTKAASQKTLDVLEITSKFKVRKNAKRAAPVILKLKS